MNKISKSDKEYSIYSLLAACAIGLLGCSGGGGSNSSQPPPDVVSIDKDPNSSPAADPAYYNVPSSALGVAVGGSNITFRYWNPKAATVTAALYNNWNDPLSSPAISIPLVKGSGGVWASAAIATPAQNFYVYNVDGTYVLDPYARSMAQWVHTGSSSITGDSVGKGAIVDPSAIAPDGGWSYYAGSSYFFDGSRMKAGDGATPAPYAFLSNRDAIIYEAGIRDLTVDPVLAGFAAGHQWGTFKALVDVLPHIQKLGVTHIQLLCPLENYYYDQTKNTQREMNAGQTSGANYNWGYDPHNYFTPSGMYSSNPINPNSRINEMKTLINEIHKQGMGVVLDVVYNHTANNGILGDATLPGYYYRSSSKNGAGSNDVKSESKMVRKIILDSIVQWVNVYHVDGFRFDLMGVMDTQTIKAAYQAAKDINPHVVFLGEGWNGYYTGAATDYNNNPTSGSDQGNSAQFKGLNVAMFSDSYRQIFKNGYPNDGAKAFLTDSPQPASALFSNIAGLPTNTNPAFAPGSSDNVINFLSVHDNLCLYDVLSLATNSNKANDATILKRAKVGYAVLLTSQGVAFIHAGDEMFRSKETTASQGASNTKSNGTRTFVDNSYNASDAINMLKWSTVYSGDPIAGGFTNYAASQNGYQLYGYTSGLITLRKSTNAFRLPDTSIAANVISIPPSSGGSSTLAFGYKAMSTDNTGTYYVFHNADSVPHAFPADADLGAALLLADGSSAGLAPITASSSATLSADGRTVTLAPLTSAIFKR